MGMGRGDMQAQSSTPKQPDTHPQPQHYFIGLHYFTNSNSSSSTAPREDSHHKTTPAGPIAKSNLIPARVHRLARWIDDSHSSDKCYMGAPQDILDDLDELWPEGNYSPGTVRSNLKTRINA
eukprot:scaffold3582_cov143-Skeletonema_marinoi.AAC.6